jgi:GAF domain-containing protein
MMTPPAQRLHQAIVDVAVEALDGSAVTLFARRGEDAVVLAAGGVDATLVDRGADGQLQYVLATGQLLSLGASPGDARPLLCVPCVGAEEILGALEIRGPAEHGPFSPEATRLASLVADLAGGVLESDDTHAAARPSPAELASELARLAETDARRYDAVASVLAALLAHG